MGTGSFPGVKRLGRAIDHPLILAPRSRKSRALPPPPSSGPSVLLEVLLPFYINMCIQTKVFFDIKDVMYRLNTTEW
jgi:hypothetical protein